MTDIAAIKTKIDAVEVALRSFARYENAEERKNYLRTKFDECPNLDVYIGYSWEELKEEKKQLQEEKKQLQEEKNLLLKAEQQSS